jgi:hypothetical protein
VPNKCCLCETYHEPPEEIVQLVTVREKQWPICDGCADHEIVVCEWCAVRIFPAEVVRLFTVGRDEERLCAYCAVDAWDDRAENGWELCSGQSDWPSDDELADERIAASEPRP